MRIREVWAAAQTKPYNVIGNFIRVASANGLTSGSIDIKLWRLGQSLLVDLMAADPGDKLTVPGGFDYLEVTSSVAQTIDLRILRGDAGSDRITGEVSILDGGKARTLVGGAFLGAAVAGPAGAQYSQVQLYNPAAAITRAILRQVIAAAGAAAAIAALRYDVATGGAVSVPSKNIGGAGSVAQIVGFTNAAALGVGQQLFFEYVQALVTPPQVVLGEPIVLAPGRGINVYCNVVNAPLVCTFEFFEEPI